ncbi:hypothetical protein PCURB6_26700 [Paenibacillus curdlanolyticus]|nr:hypothetical protein PCURB6_26700 [Paenibacillus curdlanolyticus]
MQPPRNVPCLVTNGKFARTAIYELDAQDGVYRWYGQGGYRINGVTHYAVINLPRDGE